MEKSIPNGRQDYDLLPPHIIVRQETAATPADSVDNATGIKENAKHDVRLPMSIVGCVAGMLIGTLPAALWTLIFGVTFPLLYAFMPLLIYLGIKVFKGYAGKRGIIMTVGFSLVGFYLTLLSCSAADWLLQFKMPFTYLPFVTVKLIGRGDALPAEIFSSAYIYPALFTILGVLLAYMLLYRPQPPNIPEKIPSVSDNP